jgi:hypothetical protein
VYYIEIAVKPFVSEKKVKKPSFYKVVQKNYNKLLFGNQN